VGSFFSLKQKSPGRNPGRVLNPISYEKPVELLSMHVPKRKCTPGGGFSGYHISLLFHFWKNVLSYG
jgi:hypothetical protein